MGIEDLNNFGIALQEIIANSLEDLNILQLAVIKMRKFQEIQKQAKEEELALHLIMQNIPKIPSITKFVERLLIDSIVVSVDGEVGIIMNGLCGTEFGKTLQLATIKTCCMYRVPRILDNFIIFECFDKRCNYFFKVFLRSYD